MVRQRGNVQSEVTESAPTPSVVTLPSPSTGARSKGSVPFHTPSFLTHSLSLSLSSPSQVANLKKAYAPFITFSPSSLKTLEGSSTPGSLENYGFDVGEWSTVVGRRSFVDEKEYRERMSDAAVS